MLPRMSAKADAIQHAKNPQQFGSAIRAEFPLLVGLGTIAILLVVGSDLNELTTRALPVRRVFGACRVAVARTAVQRPGCNGLPRRGDGPGCARCGVAKFHYFDQRPKLLRRTSNLFRVAVAVALRALSAHPGAASPGLLP